MRPIIGILDARRVSTTTTTTSGSTTTTTTVAGVLPHLEGYGALVTGHGYGGSFTTYTVNNLNNTGAGSLRNGIASNRRIIFSVSGTISGVDEIYLTGISNLTIDGSTAPYPGINITASNAGESAAISIGSGCNNIRVHSMGFLNCRPDADGLNVVESAQNVAVTHCIAYGNGDGNIDFANDAHHCTMQYCIIGNHVSIDGNTGGTLVTANRTTIHHNLFFPSLSPNPDEGERCPFVHRNYGTAAPGSEPDCDDRWNLVWKFGRSNGSGSGYGSGIGYGAKANVVGNYYYTTGTTPAKATTRDPDNNGDTGNIYALKNVSGNGVNLNSGSDHTNQASPYTVPAQYTVADETDACTAALKILQYAGPTQRDGSGNRPPAHAAYINGVTLPLPGC